MHKVKIWVNPTVCFESSFLTEFVRFTYLLTVIDLNIQNRHSLYSDLTNKDTEMSVLLILTVKITIAHVLSHFYHKVNDDYGSVPVCRPFNIYK